MTKLFINILDWVQSWVGNYGWSVVVFTMIIKLCLTPLDVKSRRSMRQMAMLNPKLEDLKKRYGNDQEKLNQKTQELYRKNKVNPLSGCLPLLIQLPILYIMFAAMRQVAARMQVEIVYNWLASSGLIAEDGTLLDVASTQVQAVLESIRNGSVNLGDTQSWLWIKSVFQPDNFGRTVMPSLSELDTILKTFSNKITLDDGIMNVIKLYVDADNGGAGAELARAVDLAFSDACGYKSFNVFLNIGKITYPSNWSLYVNGYYILPILAGVTQVLSTKLQPSTPSSGEETGTGKFMKWFFPIFSVWICISSNAAFAIYWVFVNVWSIISSYGVNFYLEKKDKADSAKNGSDTTKKEALQP